MKVLVTGFEPFGGEKINPAWEAVKRLEERIETAEIVKLQIPTVFGKSIDKLLEAIDEEKPDIVICIGQAGGRCNITVERIAINIDDAGISDNEGNTPIDEEIFIDGANAYFSNIPVKAMVKEMRNNNIPASLSNTAGTFVCNHIMYGLLYYIEKQYSNMRGGFIHVPYIPEQVTDKPNMPSMSLSDIVRGLNLAIKAVVENEKDIKETEGKVM